MSPAPTNRLALLIGDDDASVRASVSELVAPRGFDVYTASCGQESLQILLQHRIALTILDIHMPDMTGMEVFERFVRGPFIAAQGAAAAPPARRHLDAIFMSAAATPEIRGWCEATGSWFLDKPFEPDDMRSAIDHVLATRDERRGRARHDES